MAFLIDRGIAAESEEEFDAEGDRYEELRSRLLGGRTMKYEEMEELLAGAKVGRTDAAVLTAANIADELFKEREAGEGLRRQLKQYLDEANRAKNEVSELKRELFKLQSRK